MSNRIYSFNRKLLSTSTLNKHCNRCGDKELNKTDPAPVLIKLSFDREKQMNKYVSPVLASKISEKHRTG